MLPQTQEEPCPTPSSPDPIHDMLKYYPLISLRPLEYMKLIWIYVLIVKYFVRWLPFTIVYCNKPIVPTRDGCIAEAVTFLLDFFHRLCHPGENKLAVNGKIPDRGAERLSCRGQERWFCIASMKFTWSAVPNVVHGSRRQWASIHLLFFSPRSATESETYVVSLYPNVSSPFNESLSNNEVLMLSVLFCIV